MSLEDVVTRLAEALVNGGVDEAAELVEVDGVEVAE